MDYPEQIKQAAAYVKAQSAYSPKIGLILGSGLGTMADQIEEAEKYPFDQIPHFPVSTVEGHLGQLVIGRLKGKEVAALQGRVHFYEGYSMQQLTFPVRVMKQLGVKFLIVTNACGGLNPKLYPGALMFISDHINLMGSNPLIGKNFKELGARFPDMSEAYDKELIALGRASAEALGIETFTGVHSAVSGPYFLSRAELNMVRKFGADTVGMSTIPEVIVSVHSGMKALGISCVTDMAIPDELEPITHEKVVEVARLTRPKFISLISKIIENI